jgi:CheY-like chemotaxis protein
MARVLIVEDDPDICEVLQVLLSRSGHEASVAANGVTGLDAVTGKQPDVILLDLAMPFMDGVRVLRILKADRRFRTTPVIVITASVDPERLQSAREAGAADVIAKPWLDGQIEAAVEKTLRAARRSPGATC